MSRIEATRALLSIAASALVLTAGCRVEDHKSAGNSDDVKIATPFGGLSVKNNGADVQGTVGLPAYPGATLVNKDNESGAADVNLNFGSFHLGVRALSYRSPDAPDKVLAFYRKELGKYGAVVLCKDHRAVGRPDRTGDGLGCEKNGDNNINIDDEAAFGELKAGSRQHQHLVTIDREGGGTKFGLVALDLPGHVGMKDDEDRKQ